MPALALAIQGHSRHTGLPARSTLARWISAALESDAELTLRFVDSREGRRLNRNFRGRDYAPDVLTFGYATTPLVRADIVICLPACKREASARGKSLHDHLAHLLVHAVLHAHGLRHEKTASARAMEARETKILQSLRKPNPY